MADIPNNAMPGHSIRSYDYNLPDETIAKYPLENRRDSKLLVYKNSQVKNSRFSDLIEHLPERSLLVFNNTKVIPARLYFKRSTGARIELLLIRKVDGGENQWKCMVGNKAKFKEEEELQNMSEPSLRAHWVNRSENIIAFSSSGSVYDALMRVGEMPLPPYLKRNAEPDDKIRYQTIFAENEGAVAAPTASLHFDENLIAEMDSKDVHITNCTLHVGLGTFAPVKEDDVNKHVMHSEFWQVSRNFIEDVFNDNYKIVPVGTTSMRVVESICIAAHNLISGNKDPFHIKQGEGYNLDYSAKPINELRDVLMHYMDENQLQEISGTTSLFITPGFKIKLTHALITNFHQPRSTLLLLVATLLGNDWLGVYEYALKNSYRFLSYGDSSILYRRK